MNIILKEITENADKAYARFQQKLVPGVSGTLGLRSPIAKSIAKKYANTPEGESFLRALPHEYYDESIVHGYMLGFLRGDDVEERLAEFLPYADNWAVIDTTVGNLKHFFRDRERALPFVRQTLSSEHDFTVRFGVVALMSYYLTDGYFDTVISLITEVHRDEYYVKMAVAWLVATGLSKAYGRFLPLIETGALDSWTHNKAISKACDSYRLTDEQKSYIKTLRTAKKR